MIFCSLYYLIQRAICTLNGICRYNQGTIIRTRIIGITTVIAIIRIIVPYSTISFQQLYFYNHRENVSYK